MTTVRRTTIVRRHRRLIAVLAAVATATGLTVTTSAIAATASPSCTIYWTGTDGDGWADSGNWSLTDGGASAGRAPSASDTVCMSSDPTRFSAVLSTNVTVTTLDWPATSTITPLLTISGQLTLRKAGLVSTLASLRLAGGYLVGPGTLTTTTSSEFAYGHLSGALQLVTEGPSTWGSDATHYAYKYENYVTGDPDTEWTNRATATLLPGLALTVGGLVDDAAATITSTRAQRADERYSPTLQLGTLTNDGVLDAAHGLALAVGDAVTELTGTVSVPMGGRLDLLGDWTLSPQAQYQGPGVVAIDGSSTLDGLTDFAPGLEVGGQLTIRTSVSLSRLAVVDGGELSSVPGRTVTVTGQTTLAGAGSIDTAVTLITRGPTLIPDNHMSLPIPYFSGTWRNYGVLTVMGALLAHPSRGSLTNEPGGQVRGIGHDAGLHLGEIRNLGLLRLWPGAVVDADSVVLDGSVDVQGSPAGGPSSVITGYTSLQVNSDAHLTGLGTLATIGGALTTALPSFAGCVEIEKAGTLVLRQDLTIGCLSSSGPPPMIETLTGPYRLRVDGSTELRSTALQNGVHLDTQGATEVSSGRPMAAPVTLAPNASWQNSGDLTLDNASVTASGDAADTSSFVNAAGASIHYTGSSAAGAISPHLLVNRGSIEVDRGVLQLSGLQQLDDGTLSGGSYVAVGNGVLGLGGPVQVNRATIRLAGAGRLTSTGDAGAMSSLRVNYGTIDTRRTITPAHQVANLGTLRVSGSATSFKTASFHQRTGTTTLASGATVSAGNQDGGPVVLNGGVLTGDGTIAGALANTAATVTPGSMSVGSTYTQGTDGTLDIALRGPSTPGTDFGQLAVASTASLGGTLAIDVAPGYSPPIGTVYRILTSAGRTGTFAAVTGTDLGDRSLRVAYTSTGVTLTVVAGS